MPCTGAVAHDVGFDAVSDNHTLQSSFENYSDSKLQHQSSIEQNGVTSPKVVVPLNQSTPRVQV